MHNIKQPLINKIAELREEIATYNIDLEQATSVYDAAPSTKDPQAFVDFYEANYGAMQVVCLSREVDEYQKTLSLPLATISTRYIITDGSLVSPAGFHPSTGVYIKNNIWIETNRLPRHLDGGLNAYDMNKNDEAA